MTPAEKDAAVARLMGYRPHTLKNFRKFGGGEHTYWSRRIVQPSGTSYLECWGYGMRNAGPPPYFSGSLTDEDGAVEPRAAARLVEMLLFVDVRSNWGIELFHNKIEIAHHEWGCHLGNGHSDAWYPAANPLAATADAVLAAAKKEQVDG